MANPDPIEKLILELGRLPGIGERTAARLAFFVLKQARDSARFDLPPLARDLAGALVEVVEQVRLCEDCRIFAPVPSVQFVPMLGGTLRFLRGRRRC